MIKRTPSSYNYLTVAHLLKNSCLCDNKPGVGVVLLTEVVKGLDPKGVIIPHLQMGKVRLWLGDDLFDFAQHNDEKQPVVFKP